MEHIDIQSLKRIAQEAPQHLPILWAVYDKTIADDIIERKLTDEEWLKVYEQFSRETDYLWGALYESFSQVVYELLDNE